METSLYQEDNAVEYSFSGDEIGQYLQNLWDLYYSQLKSVSKQQLKPKFEEIMVRFISAYSTLTLTHIDSSVLTLKSAKSATTSIQPSSIHETLGHPKQFILHLTDYCTTLLNNDITATKDEDYVIDSIKLESIFFEIDGEIKQGNRKKLLIVLNCLVIIVHWSHNCQILRKNLSRNFAKLVTSLLSVLTIKMDFVFNNWFELLSNQSVENSTINETVIDFEFIMNSILLCTQFLARGNPELVNNFDNLLPEQPWVIKDLLAMNVLKSYQESDELLRHNAISADFKKVFSLSQTEKFLKSAFMYDYLECQSVSIVISLIDRINGILRNNCLSLLPVDKITIEKYYFTNIVKSCLIIQTESLFLLATILHNNKNLINNILKEKMIVSVVDATIVTFLSANINSYDIIVEKLQIRKGIICLRLNNLFKLQSSVVSLNNSHTILNLNSICQFIHHSMGRSFSTLSEEDFRNVQVGNANQYLPSAVSISYINEFINGNYTYDLWPWAQFSNDALPRDDFIYIGNNNSYRLLQSSEIFTSILATLPGYGIWNGVFSELLDLRITTSSHSMRINNGPVISYESTVSANNSKLSKSNIYFMLMILQQLFLNIESIQKSKGNDKGDPLGNNLTLPLFQIKTMEFLQALFALDRDEVFEAIYDLNLMELLVGRNFLMSKRISEEALNSNFSTIEKDVQDNVTSKSWSNPIGPMAIMIISSAYLHDIVFDYLHKFISYSFQLQSNNRPSRVPYDDILNRIIDTIKISKSSLVPSLAFSANAESVPYHQVFQTIRLLHNLSKIIISINSIGKYPIQNRILVKLLKICGSQFRLIGYIGLEPASIALNESNRKECFENDFNWMARSVVISLILQLTTCSGTFEWVKVFLSNDGIDESPQSNNPEINADVVEPSLSTDDNSRSLTFKKGLSGKNQSEIDTLLTAQKFSSSVGIDAKTRIRILFLMLLDPRTRGASLNILSSIITYCAAENQAVPTINIKSPKDDSENRARAKNSIFYSLATIVIEGLLDVISFTWNYPQECDGANVAGDCIQTLTWLLRAQRYYYLRNTIQDYIRRSDSIAHLLFALKKCVKGHANKTYPNNNINGNQISSSILRHGLSLLTAIMTGNQSCKSEFAIIIGSSPKDGKFLFDSNNSGGIDLSTQINDNSLNLEPSKKRPELRKSFGQQQNQSSPSTAPIKLPTSANKSKLVRTIENLSTLIIKAEKIPTKLTIIILFELILDGIGLFSNYLASNIESAEDLFAFDEDKPKIRNTGVFADIFCLVPSCPTHLQRFVLKSFINLLTGRASLVNVNTCSVSKPSVIDLALELFKYIPPEIQDLNVELIQVLGKHGVAVPQLKHLFRILQSNGESRPEYSARVIQSLHGMICEPNGPRQTFVFEGNHSGLKLPSIVKWPAPKSFSFCLWLKVESPKVYAAANENDSMVDVDTDGEIIVKNQMYSPCIVSLRNLTGGGIELFLKPTKPDGVFRVILKYHSELGETATVSPDLKGMVVEEDKWHFLAFTISTSGFYNTKSEASILLDDYYTRQNFASAKIPDNIIDPMIGESPEYLRNIGVNTTMRGQVGAIYFFSDALSEGQLKSICALGPDYIYNFEPLSYMSQEDTSPSSSGPSNSNYQSNSSVSGGNEQKQKSSVNPILSILDSGILMSQIILAYNPAVFKGDYFIDNTPAKNELKWKKMVEVTGIDSKSGSKKLSIVESSDDFSSSLHSSTPGCQKMHAYRMSGTYRTSTQDVRVALNSLRGIEIILPLFAQVDLPRIRGHYQNPSSSNTTYGNNNKGLFGDDDDDTNIDTQKLDPLDYQYDERFLPSILDLLITLLINNHENQHILYKVSGFGIISHLLEKVSPQHFNSITLHKFFTIFDALNIHSSLQESFLDKILCNFKLWVFSPINVQLTLFNWIWEQIASNAFVINCESLSFQKLVDNLYLFYDYEMPNIDQLYDSSIVISANSPVANDESSRQRSLSHAYDRSASSAIPSITVNNLRTTSRDSATTTSSGTAISSGYISQQSKLNNKKLFYTMEKWIRFGTNEIAGVRVNRNDLSLIRSRLFSLLTIVIDSKKLLLPENIHALVSYLHITNHSKSKLEMLDFLFNIINNEKDLYLAPQMLLGLACNSAFKSLNGLFTDDDVQVRLYNLLLFHKIVARCVNFKVLPDIPKQSCYYNSKFSSMDGDASIQIASGDGVSRTAFSVANNSIPFVSYSSAALQSNMSNYNKSFNFSDSFSALELSPTSIYGIVLNIQNILLSKIYCIYNSTTEIKNSSEINVISPHERDTSSPQTSSIGDVHTRCIRQQCLIIIYSNLLALCGQSMTKALQFIGDVQPITDETSSVSNASNLNLELSVIECIKTLDYSSSFIFRIPSLFLNILNLLSHDVIPTDIRLITLNSLHSSIIGNNKNCESILHMHLWQEHIFHLIQSEISRFKNKQFGNMNDNLSPSEEESLTKSVLILELVLSIFSCVNIYAIKYGTPVIDHTESTISSMDKPNQSNYSLAPMEVIKQISRGERHIGTKSFYDSMMILCNFADLEFLSEMNIELDTIRSVISKSIVNMIHEYLIVLQKEKDEVYKKRKQGNDRTADFVQDHIEKVMHVNTWLFTVTLLDSLSSVKFLTSATSPLSSSIQMSPTPKFNNKLEHFLRELYNDFSGVWSIIEVLFGITHLSSHNNMNYPNWMIEDKYFRVHSNFTSSATLTSDNSKERNVSVENSLRNRILFAANQDQGSQSMRTNSTDEVTLNRMNNNNLNLQANITIPDIVANAPVITNHSVIRNKKIPLTFANGGSHWAMLKLICSVYIHYGIVKRLSEFSLIQAPTITPETILQSLLEIIKHSRRATADFVVFESLYVIASICKGLKVSQSMLSMTSNNNSNNAPLNPNNAWVIGSLRVIVQLVNEYAIIIKTIIREIENPDAAQSDPINQSSLSQPIYEASAHKSQRLSLRLSATLQNYFSLDENNNIRIVDLENATSTTNPSNDNKNNVDTTAAPSESLPIEIKALSNTVLDSIVMWLVTEISKPDQIPIYDKLLNKIFQVLGYDNGTDPPLTINVKNDLWDKFVDEILEIAKEREATDTMSRCQEINISMITPETIQSSLQEERDRVHLVCEDWFESSNYAKLFFVDSYSSRIRDYIRQHDIIGDRRIEGKWVKLYSELKNERGPWGSGNGMAAQLPVLNGMNVHLNLNTSESLLLNNRQFESQDIPEVFWTLDETETNQHLRIRLKRNDYGSHHSVATSKSIGKEMNSSRTHSSSVESESGNTSNTDSTAILKIHKDLKKYKKSLDVLFKEEQLNHSRNANNDDGSMVTIKPSQSNLNDDYYDSDYEDEETSAQHDSTNIPSYYQNLNASNDVDSILFTGAVDIITPATNSSGGKTSGRIDVTKTRLMFTRSNESEGFDFVNRTGNMEFMWACQCYPSTVWNTDDIFRVFRRNYQLRKVGIEIFFTSRLSVFINLFDITPANKLYKVLTKRVKATNINRQFSGAPKLAVQRNISPAMNLTQAWMQHKISNFDYLMYLNLIAGRSFNDLSQYPVFPWIIADYNSSKLDLTNPKTFRDLMYPMGAQNEASRAIVQDKYEMCVAMNEDEPDIIPYHHGTHYSTSAMVIWYMMRLEPFTSYHIWLQEGRFDQADRLFYSLSNAYLSCTTNPQDVKELIPEMFCNPEILENVNNVSFGRKQNGNNLDLIELPPWCVDSHDFMLKHREALESEYVSMNLHHWIDLIFGYKQRSPYLPNGNNKAVEFYNTFVHLSYPDAVNLESMKENDVQLYERTIKQIDNFGQTPNQLFDKPHPVRLPYDKIEDLIWPIASIIEGIDTVSKKSTVPDKPTKIFCYGEYKVSSFPVLLLSDIKSLEKLITIDTYRHIGYHHFQPRQPDIVPPFNITVDKHALKSSSSLNNSTSSSSTSIASYLKIKSIPKEKLVGLPFSPSLLLSSSMSTMSTISHSHPSTSKAINYGIDYSVIGTKDNKRVYLEDEDKLLLYDNNNGMKSSNSSLIKIGMTNSNNINNNSKSNNNISTLTIANLNNINNSNNSNSSKMMKSSNNYNEITRNSNTNKKSQPRVRIDRVDENLSINLFAHLPDTKVIFSCGHWDNSFKATMCDTGKLIQSISYHRDLVTCIAIASDYNKYWLATGSKDCVVVIWECHPDRIEEPISPIPFLNLYGHDDSVNCIAIQPELDLIVSGSDDGTIILHTLREGSYIRSIYIGMPSSLMMSKSNPQIAPPPASPSPPSTPSTTNINTSNSNMNNNNTTPLKNNNNNNRTNNNSNVNNRVNSMESVLLEPYVRRRVHLIKISSSNGIIITFSNDGNLLSSHSINGKSLSVIDTRERIQALCLSEDGKVIITGGERCLIVMRWTHSLQIANNGCRSELDTVIDCSNEVEIEPCASPIRSLFFTQQERHLIVGLESGHIRILAQDSEYLRRKLHRKLMEIGILTF
eukprot:gene6296-8672_t